MGRGIVAAVLGYALWSGLWLGGNALLGGLWPDAVPEGFPEEGEITAVPYLVTVLALSVVCSLAAGWLAGLVARGGRRPVQAMVVLLLVTGILVQASVWAQMPTWYHLTFLLLISPVCLAASHLAPRRA